MFDRVSTVTYRVPDLAASRNAALKFFDYQVASEATLAPMLACTWGASENVDVACTLLQPASGQPFYIRLIQAPDIEGYAPLKTLGWNATELLVTDVHGLANSLTQSPFEIIGGPRDLMNNGTAIALQVLGPGRELYYLTEVNGRPMQRTYGRAESPVDRAFIVVLGASDHAATRAFYEPFSQGVTRPRQFAVRVLSDAHGLDPETTKYKLGAACLPEQFRIEIDEYPASAGKRVYRAGEFPPGLGMVSFTTASLDSLPLIGSVAVGPDEAPYFGNRFTRFSGPDGEWIEAIERATNPA